MSAQQGGYHHAVGERTRLTRRQEQVLDLIARGRTNAEIGEELGITLDGAKWHVSEILGALGVNSREEAADWWRAERRPGVRLRRAIGALAGGTLRATLIGAGIAVALAVVALGVFLAVRDGADADRVAAPSPMAAASTGHGRLFVYAQEIGRADVAGDSRAIVHVTTYDLDAGRALPGAFQPTLAPGEYLRVATSDVRIAGERLVIRLDDLLVTANLDGTDIKRVFLPSPDRVLLSFEVSRDGARIAVGTDSMSAPVTAPEISVVDLSGTVLHQFTTEDLAAGGFTGAPGIAAWSHDDASLFVYTIFYNDSPGRSGVVSLDGTVTMDSDRLLDITPDGRFAIYAVLPNVPICNDVGSATVEVRLVDLRSSTTVGMLAVEGSVLWSNWISPSGDEVLFTPYQVDGLTREGSDCWTWSPDAPRHLWRDGTSIAGVDEEGVIRDWGSHEGIEVECDGERHPWTGGDLVCPDGTSPATIVVDGQEVGTVQRGSVVGFVPAGGP